MPVRWHDQEAKTQGGAKARSNWTFSVLSVAGEDLAR